MIKVIASDMDGTLLGDNHKIAPETLAAIHRACDAGIRFMICTGRNYDSAMEELRGVDLVCDYVLGSGAEVRDPNQQVVLRHEMSMELCQRLAKVLERYPISVIYCTAERDYRIGTVEEVEESFIQQVGLFHLEMSREEILKSELYQRVRKKTVILSDFEELKTIGAPVFKVFLFAEDLKMLKEMEQELSRDPEIAVASSFITNLEITAVQAQKGPVLKQYIESLGYTMDEVMVLGDSMNDYSMLSMPFGATIAMENAMPEIKAVAKYITKSNEELGVAYAIDELLKRQG